MLYKINKRIILIIKLWVYRLRLGIFLVLVGYNQAIIHIHGFQLNILCIYKEGNALKSMVIRVFGNNLKYIAPKGIEVLRL